MPVSGITSAGKEPNGYICSLAARYLLTCLKSATIVDVGFVCVLRTHCAKVASILYAKRIIENVPVVDYILSPVKSWFDRMFGIGLLRTHDGFGCGVHFQGRR